MADYTLSARITSDPNPFIKGLARATSALDNISNKVKSVSKRTQELGQKISGLGDKLTSSITTPALAATSALAGLTLVKGFDRLIGIDTAQAKLKGLGHDAKSVEEIMNSALESVRGTAFGMDEAATTAASAVAAGIPPGKELTRYLSLVGDTAAIAGVSMAEMGSIINQVQTSQVAYTDNLNQLADRGIPIYQWLADQAGVTAAEVKKMASDGKISSEIFLQAIEDNIGGAAKTIGEESFTAAIANIGASISRIGANFLDAGGQAGGFFSTIKPMLTDFNNSLGTLEEKAADLGVKFGEAFNNFIGNVADLKSRFDALDPSVQSLILKVAAIGASVAVGAGPALKVIGMLTTSFGSLISVLGFLLSPIGLVITAITGLGALFAHQMATNEAFRSNVMSVFSQIGNTIRSVIQTVQGIIQAVAPVFMTLFNSIIGGFQSVGVNGDAFAIRLATIFSSLNPIVRAAIVLFQNFGPQLISIFNKVAQTLIPVVATIGTALGEIAASIIPVFMSALQTLIPVVIQVGMAFMQIIQMVLPILISLINQLVPIISQVVQIIAETLVQLMPLVGILVGSLLPVIVNIISTVMNIVQTVAPAFISIINVIMEVVQALIPVFMSIITVVVHVVSNVISTISPLVGFIGGIINAIMAIISPIVAFVAGIIASIIATIRPIINVITGIFNTVYSIVSGIFNNIVSFIGGAINGISTIISGLSSIVSGVFNTIYSIVSGVMSRVSSTITGVFSAIQGAWSGLTGFVSQVFSGISSSVQKLVNQVKGFINGVIGGINAAIDLINKIPGVNIGKIPYLYRGTDDWQGGFAYINEGGRGELVNLPNGAQVIPHDVSMRYAREAGRQASRDSSSSDLSLGRVETLLSQILDYQDKIANKDTSLVLDTGELVGKTYNRFDRYGGDRTRLTGRWA